MWCAKTVDSAGHVNILNFEGFDRFAKNKILTADTVIFYVNEGVYLKV